MYQSGEGYKAISKALGLQLTTVRAIMHKWIKLGTVVNLPRSGRPTKITPRVQWRLIQESIKEPRTTSKQIKQRCWSRNMSHLVKSGPATLQSAWIKKILQRRVGQNISTAMWKTHCQLSQTLDCSWCCKGWHNQLLFMGQLLFHLGPGRFGQLFVPQQMKSLFQNCILYLLGLSLGNMKICWTELSLQIIVHIQRIN